MYAFDADEHAPVWYRVLPSNGADVSAFSATAPSAAQLKLNYVRRMEADYGGCSRDDLENKRLRFDVSFLYTNTGADAKDVYLTYKARWEIEECFGYLKNGLNLSTVSQCTNEETEAWAFLNHLSHIAVNTTGCFQFIK